MTYLRFFGGYGPRIWLRWHSDALRKNTSAHGSYASAIRKRSKNRFCSILSRMSDDAASMASSAPGLTSGPISMSFKAANKKKPSAPSIVAVDDGGPEATGPTAISTFDATRCEKSSSPLISSSLITDGNICPKLLNLSSDATQQELVIPCISTNVWRQVGADAPREESSATQAESTKVAPESSIPQENRSIDDEAAAALLAEAQDTNAHLFEDQRSIDAIPLLMRNKPPNVEDDMVREIVVLARYVSWVAIALLTVSFFSN
jgi:hypothetical protein